MIVGVGIDAVSISRMSKLSDAAVKRIFSPKEADFFFNLNAVAEVRNQYLASRFAVKEAYAKARGLGFCGKISPQDITTENDENGRPYIILDGKTLENAPDYTVHLSLTHEGDMAIAIVILEEK